MKRSLFSFVAALLMTGCACKNSKPTTVPTTPEPAVSATAAPLAEPAEPTVDPATERTNCCTQCAAAASQDPTAVDIATLPCTKYQGQQVNGADALDAACSNYFSLNAELTVGECRGVPALPSGDAEVEKTQ